MPEDNQQTLWSAGQASSEKLLRRLTKLTSAGQPVFNNRRNLDSANAFAAIAIEIDETVLPRTLVFTNDRGEKLGLDVASGRILNVSQLELKTDADFATALIGHAFFDADDPLCHVLYKVLINFEHDLKSLFVSTIIKSESHSFSNIGITVNSLQNAQHSATAQLTKEAIGFGHANFIEHVRSVATALVCTDSSRIVESWGDENLMRSLELLANEEMGQNEDPQDSSQNASAQMAIWGNHMQNGQAVSCISLESQMIFVTVLSAQVPFLIGAWEKVIEETNGPATDDDTGGM